jgi:hypothetical protein
MRFYATLPGLRNTADGSAALNHNTTGTSNIAMGTMPGSNLTTGSNNIDLGAPGVAGESGVIRKASHRLRPGLSSLASAARRWQTELPSSLTRAASLALFCPRPVQKPHKADGS